MHPKENLEAFQAPGHAVKSQMHPVRLPKENADCKSEEENITKW
jgi:hypothetical protein